MKTEAMIKHEENYKNDGDGNYTRYLNTDHAKEIIHEAVIGCPESKIDDVANFMIGTDSDVFDAADYFGI